MTCNNVEDIDPNDIPQDIKLFTRGIFPDGIIMTLKGARETDVHIIMSKLWRILVERVEKRNNSQVILMEDRYVAERIEDLRKKKNESQKLRNMLNKSTINKIKKRSYKDFCTWERQVSTEIKKVKKLRVKERKNMEKFLIKTGSRDNKGNTNMEILTDQEEDLDMNLAVQEEMRKIFGNSED